MNTWQNIDFLKNKMITDNTHSAFTLGSWHYMEYYTNIYLYMVHRMSGFHYGIKLQLLIVRNKSHMLSKFGRIEVETSDILMISRYG